MRGGGAYAGLKGRWVRVGAALEQSVTSATREPSTLHTHTGPSQRPEAAPVQAGVAGVARLPPCPPRPSVVRGASGVGYVAMRRQQAQTAQGAWNTHVVPRTAMGGRAGVPTAPTDTDLRLPLRLASRGL